MHTWLRFIPHDSLSCSLPLTLKIAHTLLLVFLPDLSYWQGLCIGDKFATPYRLDTFSLTSLSHSKMTALVSTLVTTCFRTQSHRRVVALLSSREHSSYYSKVWMSVDTIHDSPYTPNLFKIVTAEYNIHKGYYYSIKPWLHRAHQSPSLRAHIQFP